LKIQSLAVIGVYAGYVGLYGWVTRSSDNQNRYVVQYRELQ